MEEISSFIFPFLEERKMTQLKQNGIRTVMDFLIETSDKVRAAGGLTSGEYTQARMDALNFVSPKPITGTALFHKLLDSKPPFSTGIPKLDLMLGGGLRGGDLVEFYGKSNTGKTQICLWIMSRLVSRIRREMGYYIDLKTDFQAMRVFRMSNETDKHGLRNIWVVRESKIHRVLRALDTLEHELTVGQTSLSENIRVLVLDAIPFAIYPTMTMGLNEAGRGIQEILAQQLKRIATNYQISVILVNHAVSVYGSKTKDGSEVKTALGKFWRGVPDIRILLSRDQTDENKLRATLEKSVRSATNLYFEFQITENGIE